MFLFLFTVWKLWWTTCKLGKRIYSVITYKEIRPGHLHVCYASCYVGDFSCFIYDSVD